MFNLFFLTVSNHLLSQGMPNSVKVFVVIYFNRIVCFANMLFAHAVRPVKDGFV